MQEAKNRFDKVQAQAELELQPQVNKAEAEVEKAERRLIDFSEFEVIPFLSNTISYSKILPQRADELAGRYGQTFGLDPERITSLDELMKLINPYIEARAKRDKKFSPLLEQRPLFDIPAKDLPEPIQHRLRVWTSYQFSLLLAQEGIIEKPQLPDVLRRL